MQGIAINASDLARILGNGGGGDKADPAPIPEAQIAELRQRAAAYAATLAPMNFPFRVGDVVTAKAGSNYVNQGSPMVVVEVNPHAEPVFIGNEAGTGFGMRPQVRVIEFMGGAYIPFWKEAFQLEAYTGPGLSPDGLPAA